MSELLNDWHEARQAREDAEDWNNLPKGKKHNNSEFEIFADRCSVEIVRSGQKKCGGKSYWDSGEALNKAILRYIVRNWKYVWPKVIEDMRDAESEALTKCHSYVDELEAKIDRLEACDHRPTIPG